ncbi:MAG TPA: hypothetical protein PKM88_08825 [bacterium]|nr:hypothetical protein [bacterium]
MRFVNESLSGGFRAEYADTGAAYHGHDCYIRGRHCHADEAKFGGIVIRPAADTPPGRDNALAPVPLLAAALLKPVLFWGLAVPLVTFFGYPGIIFLTPVAWLTALHCGTSVAGTIPVERGYRFAALAGLLLGIFHGLLFAIWAVFALPPVQSHEQHLVWFWCGLFSVASPLATTGLAVAAAWWRYHRA